MVFGVLFARKSLRQDERRCCEIDSSSISTSLLRKLQAVTSNDLASVTLQDVLSLKDFHGDVNPDELKNAMKIMLENQRFSEVLDFCPSNSFNEACKQVEASHKMILRPMLLEKLTLLYGVLPFIPSSLVKV